MNKTDSSGSSFSLFDNLLEGCQIIGFDWSYIYLNKAAEVHNRRANTELYGMNYIISWPGIENTHVFRVIKRCMEDRISEKIENEFIYLDGKRKWFLLSIQPMPMGILILSVDITDNKLSEKALIESERKFKSVFESSNIAKSITTLKGEINVNKAFCDMLGYSTEELKNKNWADITPQEEIGMINNEVDSLIKGVRRSTRFKKRYVHKNGSLIWTDVSVALVLDETGKPLYFLTTVVDITEQKHAEMVISKLNEELEERVARRTSQLESANRELETFTYSVSHDLKAPLRGIDGYSKLLDDMYKNKLDEEAQFFISSIRSSTLKMNQIIDDLLEYSRLDRSKMTLTRIKISEFISSIISAYSDEVASNKFKLALDSPDIEIMADPKGLKIALRNLIDNAIKFSAVKSDPFIRIRVEERESSWLLSVNDNGVGFEMKYSQKIFVIFQRLHKAEEFPGTGIGLAMVSKAMQKMDGKAWAESTPGIGSTFYLEMSKTK
jgi:PAS domain S-box-containing protein